MANYFDQFDKAQPQTQQTTGGNFFDQFDAPQQPSYLSRVGSDILKRANEGADAIVSYNAGDQGLGQTALQLAGKLGAAPIADIAGETIKSGYQSLPQGLQDIGSKAANYISDSAAGDVARQYAGDYQNFAKNNPNAARSIESAADISSLIPIGKATQSIAEPLQAGMSDVAKGAEGLADTYATKYPNATPFDSFTPKTIQPISPEGLGAASSLKYQEMRDAGATLNQGGIDLVNNSVDQALKDSGLMNERLHGDTMSVVGDLKKDASAGSLDLEKLDQYRQLLGNVVSDNTTKLEGMNQDAMKASTAINAIDGAVDSLGEDHLSAGTPEAKNALNQARDLYSGKARLGTVQNIIDNAYMTDNPATAMRTGFRNLAKQVNVSPRGWNPDEVAAINKAAKTGIAAGALKTMGGRLISGIAGTAAGFAGGGPLGAPLGLAAGEAIAYPMRAAANALQESRGNAVADLIKSRPAVTQAIPQSINDIMRLPPAQAKAALNALRVQQLQSGIASVVKP